MPGQLFAITVPSKLSSHHDLLHLLHHHHIQHCSYSDVHAALVHNLHLLSWNRSINVLKIPSIAGSLPQSIARPFGFFSAPSKHRLLFIRNYTKLILAMLYDIMCSRSNILKTFSLAPYIYLQIIGPQQSWYTTFSSLLMRNSSSSIIKITSITNVTDMIRSSSKHKLLIRGSKFLTYLCGNSEHRNQLVEATYKKCNHNQFTDTKLLKFMNIVFLDMPISIFSSCLLKYKARKQRSNRANIFWNWNSYQNQSIISTVYELIFLCFCRNGLSQISDLRLVFISNPFRKHVPRHPKRRGRNQNPIISPTEPLVTKNNAFRSKNLPNAPLGRPKFNSLKIHFATHTTCRLSGQII